MADVIRQLPHRHLNVLNTWPVTGMFIHHNYAYTKFKRRWLAVSLTDLPSIIANVFEQTHYKTVVFALNVNINERNRADSLVDIEIDTMGDIAVPIEVLEKHDLISDLSFKINETATGNEQLDITLHCYVKGWFW